MMPVLALLCSPHANGVSDTVAGHIASGMTEAGLAVRMTPLRRYVIDSCRGCNVCASPPHACVLADSDDAESLFALMQDASLLLISAPIYFYSLPAHCKAFIDRAQRFWSHAHMATRPPRQALVALTAGRSRGEQLFRGALLTLKYFLATQNMIIAESRQLRGLETVADLASRPALAHDLHAWGHAWGQRLVSCAAGNC